MKTKHKRKAVPKHFWGALLSTGVGLLSSNMAANKANNNQKRIEEISRRNKYKEELYNDSAEADAYQDDISNSVQGYYQAKGGKLAIPPISSTKGGKLKPISSDMVIAKGNKHEESKIDNTSGIKLIKNGKAFAEIEDEETIKDGRMVYSDRLTVDGKTTYADAAKKLAKEKSKIETNQAKGDVITNTTNKRKLAGLDKKEDALFLHQEQSKNVTKTQAIPKGKDGLFLDKIFGKLGEGQSRGNQIGSAITPFIDNIGNALITAKTPKLAAPSLDRVKNLKTKINVNPQLNAITQGVSSASQSIKNNTSNSNVARANIASNKIQGATAKANILANKENQETSLHNANQRNVQATMSRNNDKIDANNYKQALRSDDIGRRNSANLANLAGDFIDKRNFDAITKYQDEQLDIAREIGNSGVNRRTMLKNPTEVALMKQYPEKYASQYKGTPEEKLFSEVTGYKFTANTVKAKPITF